jgi:hypothetical protein
VNISKEFLIESYFPVPVLMGFFSNPYLFFSSSVHISVIKETGENEYEIAILPYTDEAKNTSYYGILSGPVKEDNSVKYNLRSINFAENFEMSIKIDLSRMASSSRVTIAWAISSESAMSQIVGRSTMSLNPDHMVNRHMIPYLKVLENLARKMDSDERFMFERVIKDSMDTIPFLKERMENVPSYIAVGNGNKSSFYAEIHDRKIEKLVLQNGTVKIEGGDAIMSILNESGQFEISLFFPEFRNHKDKFLS